MAYVIGSPCVNVKDTACVDACPVDAIHSKEGANQYFIDPVTCIDCDACRPACPVEAIWAEDQVPANEKKFVQINADFFKGFDKSESTTYKREKKTTEEAPKEEGATAEKTSESKQSAEWVEVTGWEDDWLKNKKIPEDPVERQKRYGRVRSVYEQEDRYIVRVFLPEVTPAHPFVFRYDLPREINGYTLRAEVVDGAISVVGVLKDDKLRKLCGLVNSFPDRFQFDQRFPVEITSVSVVPKSDHVVDVVAVKSVEKTRAA